MECISGEYSSLRRLVEQLKESGIIANSLKSNLHFSKKSPPSSIPSRDIESAGSPSMMRRKTQENKNATSKGVGELAERKIGSQPRMKQNSTIKRMDSKNLNESLLNQMKNIMKDKKGKSTNQQKPALPGSPKPCMKSATKIDKMSKEVAEKLLNGRPHGTWILRLNEREEKRITVVKSSRTFSHIRLHESAGGLFSLTPDSDDQEHLHTLLRNLQGSGTLGTQYFP